jgi:hypothetical protein
VTGGWKTYWNQDIKKYCFAHNCLKINELHSLCTTHGKAGMEDMKERGNLEDLDYVGGQ